MSATRHGGQASKRSPQPKAEVVTSSSSSKGGGSSRGSDTGSSAERNRNDHIRGNQGAGLESSLSGVAAGDRKKTKSSRKNAEKDVGSNHWNNQKNRSREAGSNWVKTPSPTSANAPVATKGASSNNHTPSSKPEGEEKPAQSHTTNRGKSSGKQPSTKGHRSNHTYSEPGHCQRDLSPSSSSVGSSTNDTSYSKVPVEPSSWTKSIYPSPQSDKPHPPSSTTTPSERKGGESREGGEYMCWHSGGSDCEGDWNGEGDMDQLLWSSSTDDYKIRKFHHLYTPSSSERPRPISNHSYFTGSFSSGQSNVIEI